MKKIVFMALVAAIVVAIGGCEKKVCDYNGYYVVVNDTEREIAISTISNSTLGGVAVVAIAPGESETVEHIKSRGACGEARYYFYDLSNEEDELHVVDGEFIGMAVDGEAVSDEVWADGNWVYTYGDNDVSHTLTVTEELLDGLEGAFGE
ncbi:MAG: hypothetical protein LBV38_04755 [Alistipes sp.]|jgi:hypothetical protein|nr:hypothetical protein [Alistipes sp.]